MPNNSQKITEKLINLIFHPIQKVTILGEKDLR